ncbi:Uncharacterized protein, Rmd1/YagE family [Mariprofundus ferrinatatus]|uniref:Uncharacterized protein, Rmd1/YagE family n=1 Tax=Mariprofundus ferrinatatus TaxID=1921087 RepID=A0A2K8L454_9PROT|nr:RMD1 family protein [Mariprofundus ferrinatatus]ATX82105.1 Uncharacterized protein, Rmd1/YagE family [Mariprofundus ferrinatatus]
MQQRCNAYVLAKHFHFEPLCEQLSGSHRACTYRNAIHLDENSGDVFMFDYGVVVFWGMDHDSEQRLLSQLTPFLNGTLQVPISDFFTYEIDPEATARIRSDHITLNDDDVMVKLAISHGIAQSLKLSELEAYAEKTIEDTSYIPRNMAESGSSRMGRKEIARMRGQLFLVESDILLHHALLDTPEFFWEYPELEEHYRRMASYLDTTPRVEVLSKKLQIIHEMFDMLADEQKHKHSSMLEWIIIWLIAIEIFIFLGHDLLKVF